MNTEFVFWVIHGTEPGLWSVPFRVRWEDKRAVCVPAAHLNVVQARAVTARLNGLGTREGEGWRLSSAALNKAGDQLPDGAIPEEYFGWERMKSAARRQFKPEKEDPDRAAFIDWVYQHGILYPFASRRPEVALLWHQLCKASMDWLINEERPLDLYFLRLHNWPWRVDWKEKVRRYSVDFGFKRNVVQMKTSHSPSVEEIENSPQLREAVTTGPMFHMIDPYVCSRFVEVEHTRAWWRTIRRVEHQRWKMLKAEGYAEAFLRSVQRQWPQLVRVLHCWMANSLHPSVEFLESSVGSRRRFVPRLRGLAVSFKLRRLRTTALRLALPSIRGRKRTKIKVRNKAISLHPMPPLRPLPKDMR